MRVPYLAFALCALACLVAHIAILRSVIRGRSAVIDPNVPRPNLLVEVVWAVLPALVLAFVLTATWDRVRDNAASRPDVLIEVAQ